MRRILCLAVLALLSVVSGAEVAPPDWKTVEQALGKTGQLQAGDVFRIAMPRTDLSVSVNGVPVQASFALGSYAAFKEVGDHAMVMGDLVLLDPRGSGHRNGNTAAARHGSHHGHELSAASRREGGHHR
jgi:hypothetical protein